MKKPFSISNRPFAIFRQRGKVAAPRPAPGGNWQLAVGSRQARAGVALVITLIMLSVTLVMAVAFLAVAHRERNAVSTTTDTATARLAADSALAAAQAQVAANILASTNVAAYSYGLLVSTNFINALGLDPNSGSPTNVNYDYTLAGIPLTLDQRNQNIADLLFLPRAPVFIKTNQFPYGNDFRFYLDLNQNGRDEANNNITNYDTQGNLIMAGGNNPLITSQPGDPEWIGVLEHPDQPHGPNNHFLARYAFAALPVGNSLDLNAIHNQVRNPNQNLSGPDVFFRNQDVGTWELNLAGFLADLNTNEWGKAIGAPSLFYQYNEPIGSPNIGYAFEDARALLAWRYAYNYNNLASANLSFSNAANVLRFDGIDTYGDGALQTSVKTNADFPVPDPTFSPWAGANNPNRFYTLPSELPDPTKSSPNFVNHLFSTGISNSTYDRYTFYRLLDQLGTDTAPESGRLNLNYSNAVVSYSKVSGIPMVTGISIVPGAETNLVPWAAQNFFLAAADAMLRSYTASWYASNPTNFYLTCYGFIPQNYVAPDGFGVTNLAAIGMTNEVPAFGITNIPVFINGQFTYTPAINRVLQLAANLFDASTNSPYPSVFRPLFRHDIDHNVFIVGYTNLYSAAYGPNTVSGTADPQLALPLDVTSLANDGPPTFETGGLPIMSNSVPVNVYGVPWIIGAKKGLPGLNQFSMVNSAQFTRKLQLVRNYVGGPFWTNQMVVMSVTNNMGISFWNSYATDYPTNYGGGLNMSIVVHSEVQSVVTNSDWAGPSFLPRAYANYIYSPTRWPGSQWAAYDGGAPSANSFFAWQWTNTVVPQAVYNFTSKSFNPTALSTYFWDTNRTVVDPLPQFGLLTTNWLQAYIVDGTHVIDYVQLRGPINNGNLNSGLSDPNYPDTTGQNYLWSTNVDTGGVSYGVANQIDISSQNIAPPPSAQWKNPGVKIPGITDIKEASRIFFGAFMKPNSVYQYSLGGGLTAYYTNFELAVQAPYTASRLVYVPYLYQVNDPLVHYTVNDLDAGVSGVWANGNVRPNGVWGHTDDSATSPFPVPPPPGTLGGRYQPWGKTVQSPTFQSAAYNFDDPYNLAYKDPLVWGSDYWDFPTNKYPTVGWIGRVHRGTPWQTVYLKAHNVLHSFYNTTKTIASGTNTWVAWTGDYNNFDAANSGPVQDRQLFDLFTAAPNENASRGQLSVNQTHLAAWSAVLSGMVALTNIANMPPFNTTVVSPTSNSWMVIQPAGVGGVYSPLGSIVTNINNMRAGFTNLDGVVGTFEHKGDVLSVAALTEQSPFLNWNNVNQRKYGISDAVYEWLPQQMMSLLTCPTAPRYVVYCYGQALKPAQDGLVTSSATLAGGVSSFGLVTNYQVVAESAARAVIRVDRHVTAAGTNYTTTVESYNPLPPN